METVLLHDWLTGFRGGERVLEAFCQMYPDAPLYTLLYKKGSTSDIIENRKITTSFLNKVPGIHKHYRKFLPMFPRAADSLKITENPKLVLSSSHCVIKAVQKPAGSKHICYIHSPMRYIYDQFEAYFGEGAPLYQQFGARALRDSLTNYDLESNKNVDLFIANSEFVRQRIHKYYNLDAKVVHPFVELDDFKAIQQRPLDKEDYFVILSAFAPNKKVDVAIRAFNRMGKKLVIVGSGQKDRELREMANKNIIFRGNISREEVISTLAKAKALIFPGVEDFGIVPLESLASGTPVIAYKAGGVLETINEKVGLFFEEQSVDSLCRAVEEFNIGDFDRQLLIMRAEEFSRKKFIKNMQAIIDEELSK